MQKKLEAAVKFLQAWSARSILLGMILSFIASMIARALIPGYSTFETVATIVIMITTFMLSVKKKYTEAHPLNTIKAIHQGAF